MSPTTQDRSTPERNQEIPERGPQRARRPRSRLCLLKGCESRFRPAHPLTRYCSEGCRRKAREWSQWKSRQRYRQSEGGRQTRQKQSRRYRERVEAGQKVRRREGPGARVIIKENLFRLLRSSRLLCELRAEPAFAAATVLLPRLPACTGTGLGKGKAMAVTGPCRAPRRWSEPSVWPRAPAAAVVRGAG